MIVRPGCRIAWEQIDELERRLPHAEADFRLEPLAVLVDQTDDGDGHIEQLGDNLDDAVEPPLSWRVENLKGAQSIQALRFAGMIFCTHIVLETRIALPVLRLRLPIGRLSWSIGHGFIGTTMSMRTSASFLDDEDTFIVALRLCSQSVLSMHSLMG